MTLIYSALGEGFCALGDLLVMSSDDRNLVTVGLPFWPDGLTHHNNGDTIVSLRHKVIVAGRTLMLWAGPYGVARAIIKAIYEASNCGENRVDFDKVCNDLELNQAEIDSISIIYHYYDGHIFSRRSHGCWDKEFPGGMVICDGTGAWDFVAGMTLSTVPANEYDQETILKEAILRMAYAIDYEACSSGKYNFGYGGWLELAIVENDRFVKLPYAVKFWLRTAGDLRPDGAAIFSWYVENDLVVCNARVVGGKSKPSYHVVSDFLGRKGISSDEIPYPVWSPRFVIHIVIDEDERAADIVVKFPSEDFHVQIDPSTQSLRTEFSRDLFDELLSAKSRRSAQTQVLR